MNPEFPQIITNQRKQRKISQKQAAADLGISQALLSHYEKGIRECGLDFLVKIADYYNVSCDYLLGRCPEQIIEKKSEKTDTIADFADAILSVCQKSENQRLENSAYSYMLLSMYKLFLILSKNEQETVTKIPHSIAESMADTVIIKSCADIKLECNAISFRHESTNTPAFLNLIKTSENKISEIYE